MPVEQERISEKEWIPNWVWWEHLARFKFGAKFVKNKTVIDCACGNGIGSKIFADASAEKVLAFDIDERVINKLKGGSNLSFDVADGRHLPVEDNFADVYISFETVEHINEDKEYLSEAVRVLKPGGVFVCSTPNREVTNPGKKISDKPANRFHVREYSESEFTNLLNSYFKDVKLYGQNPQSIFKTKAIAMLGRLLPMNGAVLINRAFKIPRLFFDSFDRRSVLPIDNKKRYEYLVAVCKK